MRSSKQVAADARTQALNDFVGSAEAFSSVMNDLMEEQLRAAVGARLSLSQLRLLKLVSLTEAHTLSNLATFMGITSAAASKSADRLVRDELLRRSEGEADRRAIKLSLTERGRRVLASYETAANRALQRFLEPIPADRLQQIADVLDQLTASVVERAGASDSVCLRCGIYFRDRCLLRQTIGCDCYYYLRRRGSGDGAGKTQGRDPRNRGEG